MKLRTYVMSQLATNPKLVSSTQPINTNISVWEIIADGIIKACGDDPESEV